MKKFKFYVDTGFVGSQREDTFEFDDDVTEEEINETFEGWVWETINAEWSEV